jgi:hypothetical protein
MEKLRTPESILKQHLINIKCLTPDDTYQSVIEAIKTAHREAIELAIKKIDDEIEQSENDYATQFLISAKDSILNLLPK